MYTCGKSFFGLLAPTSSDLAAYGYRHAYIYIGMYIYILYI